MDIYLRSNAVKVADSEDFVELAESLGLRAIELGPRPSRWMLVRDELAPRAVRNDDEYEYDEDGYDDDRGGYYISDSAERTARRRQSQARAKRRPKLANTLLKFGPMLAKGEVLRVVVFYETRTYDEATLNEVRHRDGLIVLVHADGRSHTQNLLDLAGTLRLSGKGDKKKPTKALAKAATKRGTALAARTQRSNPERVMALPRRRSLSRAR